MKLKLLLFLLLTTLVFSRELPIAQVDQEFATDFYGYAKDRLIVKFDQQTIRSFDRDALNNGRTGVFAIDQLNERYNARFMRKQFLGSKPERINGQLFDLSTLYKIMFSGEIDPIQLVEAYSQLPGVIEVQPVGIHGLSAVPNDAQYDLQWHLNQVNDADVDAPEAWDIETGSEEVIVAILDTGVRYYHVDLGGGDASYTDPTNVDGNMWVNWDEKNGVDGVDDDGNGFVDDWIGWDFVESAVFPPPSSGEDGEDQDNDPRDFNGHGTHCAGNVAALTNNGGGLCAVSGGWGDGTLTSWGNGVKAMALRIGYDNILGGSVLMDAAAEAFYYAANNGAKIASCSWGSSDGGGMPDAVDYFLANGGMIFHASGNSGVDDPDYLDNRGDCISVAATDSNDTNADFTNFGDWIDISAPGTKIYSTYHVYDDDANDYIAALDGTSMSTPIVAGVAALIWSQNPSWTAADVEQHLYDTADNIEDNLPSNRKGLMGAGRVNAYNAVFGGSSESITLTAPNGGEEWQVGSSQTITWTSSGTSGNVQLEYSTNNGGSWTTITASTTDDGSHDWTIPDDPSTQCLVQVTDTDGSPSDQSDALFTILAVNQPPSASDVVLEPASPVTGDDLTGSYTYNDPDGDPESGTEIRWYRDATLVSSLNDQLTVGAGETSKGEEWYFTVRPSDGSEFGTLETSNTVTIGNTAPEASDLAITPSSPYENDDLQANYTYNDADSDAESGSEIRWYQNGAVVATYNDQTTVPSSATAVNDEWYFTVKPSDGTDFGALQTSASVTILEQVVYQITDLRASVQSDNILLEWSELPGATEYNIYRGTSYDFVADVAGGSNRIAERISDEDGGTTGVQWTDTGNGADVVGDLATNYFYRVTGFTTPAQGSSTTKENDHILPGNVITGGTPHTAFGQVFNADTSVPANGDIEFESYITTRPDEILTQSSTGCSYADGYWSVAVGNFSTAWSVGEVLRTDVRNIVNGETGAVDVVLTDAGSDEAEALYLNSETESEPSNVAGEFDVELLTTTTTDINELVVIMNTTNTRQHIVTAEDLAQAIPNCTDVYYWSASGQGQVGHPKGTPIENFEIKPGYPYIVNVSANTIWTNAGTYEMATFNLVTTSSTDINHIGVPFEKSHLTTADELGQDIPSCTDVYYWDVTGQGQVGHPVGTPVEDFPVYAAFPYYVNVTAEATWPSEAASTTPPDPAENNQTMAQHIGSNVPHTAYGKLNMNGIKGDLYLRAWIVGRENDVLTNDMVGTGFDHEYWWIGVGNFAASWQADDRLTVEFIDADGSLLGRQTITLTNAGSDKGEEMVLGVLSDIAAHQDVPEQYELQPNYPNPFNPSTTLQFGLPSRGHVKMSIYSMNGRLVRTLLNSQKDAASHPVVSDARNDAGLVVSSGIYLCRIESGDWHQTMKLIFAK